MKPTRTDLSRHISLQIGVLKLIGVWFYIPYGLKNVKFWIRILTRTVLGIVMFVVPTSSQLIYVVRLILSGNAEIQVVAGIINLIMTEMLVSLRLLDLSLRRHLLMELWDQLKSDEFQFYSKDHKEILEKAISFSRTLFWVLAFSSSADVFVSQLDILIYNFENMENLVKETAAERQCNENEAFKEVFKRCILHHSSILRFVNTIQATFSGLLSATLFLSTGILGSTAVILFAIESPTKNLTEVSWVLAYLVVFVGNLYIDCYFGNTITVKSLHISTVVFSCPWIKLPTTLKKDLIIFIAKTQRPLVITAAKLVPVSLETFTKSHNLIPRPAVALATMIPTT
ncbi:hypothetical protein PYW07_002847 [Mythimna separata]|uniref:Odorant receptor n=1 Tax=Mythimna separata TaxID=271217 RepID=A0AAD8DPU1_MYTSE|nr:hypothetical protein PYW07_002847 [Mythimna separata]